MKSLIVGIVLSGMALSSAPAMAEQYLYEGYNGYHYNHKHRKHNHNNNNDWATAGAFLGGIIIGGMLDRRYEPQPYAYQQPYPQPHYQPAPRWAGPRYCESMLYYDAWGNLVQSRDCYR